MTKKMTKEEYNKKFTEMFEKDKKKALKYGVDLGKYWKELTKSEEYSLSDKEIEKIKKKQILGADKWFRMYCGFSTELIEYKDKILHIRIKNTESKYKTKDELNKLGILVLQSWTCYFDKKDLEGYVFYLYKTNRSPGFHLIKSEINNKDLQKEIKKMKMKESLTLVTILSGTKIPDTSKL